MKEKREWKIEELIVVKRSGQRVEFNSTKIALAIKKSFDQVTQSNSEKQINKVYADVLLYIKNNYIDRKTINVEDIQDIIEERLKANKQEEVYKSFNEYRERRAASRKAFNIKQQHKFVKAIEHIIDRNKEGKNISYSPNDLLLSFGKTIACEYTKAYVLDNKFVRAHEEGTIYIHNLDYFHLGKISSTHLILENDREDFKRDFIVKIMEAKKEIDGEIAIDALDDILAPIILKKYKRELQNILNSYLKVIGILDYINSKKLEETIEKEVKIDFDIHLFSQFILNEKVKEVFLLAQIDAKEKVKEEIKLFLEDILNILNENGEENPKYTISIGANTKEEGKICNICYLETLEKLERKENVTTIYKVIEKGDSNLLNKISNLIIADKNIAISFLTASYNRKENINVEYFSTGNRIFENEAYEEVGTKGRMIVASVSINMGRLGFKYEKKKKQEFIEELDETLELAKNCLITIFETIGNKNKDNYKYILNGNILDDDKLEYGQKIRKILKKGVLNLELAGLKECVCLLEEDSEKQKKLLYEILSYTKDKCKKYSIDSHMNFVVSETCKYRPLHKLIALDKAIYGMRKNITDKDTYGRIDTLFKFKKDIKEDLQEIGKIQGLLTGGSMVQIQLSKNTNTKEILNIIKIAEQENVGFLKLEVKR